MAVTKLSNLVDPQVMADAISAELPEAIKFTGLARIDTTLKEVAGSTITIPRFSYIGDAKDVGEGQPIPIDLLNATTSSQTVKKAGRGIKLTDESLIGAYGNVEEEAKNQLLMSVSNKLDNDCLEALKSIKVAMTVDKSTAKLDSGVISEALVKFGEAIGEQMVLLIAPSQLAELRTSPEFVRASELGDQVLTSGVIGSIYGCQVVVSSKIKPATGKITNFIVKPDALVVYMKKDVEVEMARDIEHKLTTLTVDQHYIVALENESKAIKLITSE